MPIQPVWIFRVNDSKAVESEEQIRVATAYATACLQLLSPIRAVALYPWDTDKRWGERLGTLGVREFYPPQEFPTPPVFIHTDLSQPVDLEFFTQGLKKLEMGEVNVVSASRRHPDARFRIDVRHLRYIHGRYLLSRFFNLFLQVMFKIRMEDTHTPHWMTTDRVLGLEERRSYSSFFLAAIERAIEIHRRGLRLRELPCNTRLLREKNPFDFFRELGELARSFPRLFRRARKKLPAPTALLA